MIPYVYDNLVPFGIFNLNMIVVGSTYVPLLSLNSAEHLMESLMSYAIFYDSLRFNWQFCRVKL